MRLDVLSIFSDYFAPLDLSLVGKARRQGLLELHVHDLRDWTSDRHRSVDDTPVGGGAGMVMRPDVWGRALDAVLDAGSEAGTVLLVPSPAGQRLDQALVAGLARASRLVIACGRYEGIDERVVEHYHARGGLRVVEVSVGDYVLNGGEAAALVIVEAVARLLPGVVGNPGSLEAESHGGSGLLDHPSYTKPVSWRQRDVPEVLRSGHHENVSRWRRDAALRRTAERRPDLLDALSAAQLNGADRRVLAALGWFCPADGRPRRLTLRRAVAADAAELAALAAATFPLACPPDLPHAAIERFVAEQLSTSAMTGYLHDTDRRLLVAAEPDTDRLVGYTMLTGIGQQQVALDKCYVAEDYLGSHVAAALLACSIEEASAAGAGSITLGTNAANTRAQRFYARHGFIHAGTRSFTVGGVPQHDVVMTREISVTGCDEKFRPGDEGVAN